MIDKSAPEEFDDDPLDEADMKELEKLIESNNRRGYPGHGLRSRRYQPAVEVSAVENWANELGKQESICICDIRKNTADFPDCIAELNGKQIGIEVTELTVSAEERKVYLNNTDLVVYSPDRGLEVMTEESLKRDSPEWKPPKSRPPNTADWSFEEFREKLTAITQKKGEKAQSRQEKSELIHLHKLFLLIVTDEPNLSKGVLNRYLPKIELPRPHCFDNVYYVMGPPEATADNAWLRTEPSSGMEPSMPADKTQRERCHPVYEVAMASSASPATSR